MLPRGRLLQLLKKKYPKGWFKKGEEFSAEHKRTIWSGEGSYDVQKINDDLGDADVPLMDYYADEELWNNQYDMSILKSFREYIESKGWFIELYDAGTFFIFPSE